MQVLAGNEKHSEYGQSFLTRYGHDGDREEGCCAADDVEDGEACVGCGCCGEQEAEQVHEGNHRPAIQKQQQQNIHQVVFGHKRFY